jgi:type I restriction enzyme S subunit
MKETRFKDTEVGRIPEDWTVSTIENIAMITTGSQNTQDNEENGDYPFYVRSQQVERINKWIFDTEGVVTAGDGVGTGKVFHYVNGKFGLHQRCYLIHNFVSNMSARFFFWIFSNNFYERVHSMTAKSSVDSVRREMIAGMQIPIPPKSEQTRIATALSKVDALISELGRLIEKKRAIKQGAMQQLLTGKKRLKGFSEPWVEKKLGEICDVKRGVRVTRETLTTEGQYPVFQNTNYPLGYFNKYNVAANTPFVIVGGSAGLVGLSKNNYWAADDCAYFDNCVELNLVFLYYILLLRQNEIERHVRTASVPRLDRKNIEDLVILIPSLIEQSAIASVLTSMGDEITALEAQKAKYEQIKQGMMQQLLTGKIRLANTVAKTNTTTANVHFRRSVLAAEIAERLYEEPTFGHVKMEKMLFLTERLCHIDIGSHYHRDAAGPYDNRALRSIDSQLRKQKWFDVKRTEKGNRYVPMQNRGKHKTYFDKYYSTVLPTFEKIIDTFKTQNTERCEIVATLYSAWEDLLHSNKPFTDADIVNEVLNNWHESKKRISKERWLSAIQWMRENGFAPDVRNNESRK